MHTRRLNNDRGNVLTTTAFFRGKDWRWPLALFAITLLALALRWYYVSTALVIQPVRGDATQYYTYAWNLVNHGVFAHDLPGSATVNPDNFRDPGYPFFLAIWMKALGVGDAWYAAVLLCQSLLGALTVTLVTQLSRHWLPSRWAIAAGLLMAAWPHSITINGYLLSETLFGFLCALGLLLCARATRRQSPWWAIAAGVALGAAALTNAVMLPFGILLAGFLAWRKLASRKICVALAAGALLLPGAWAIRNSRIAAPMAGNSSLDRALLNLEQGSWTDFQSAWRDSVLGDAADQATARAVLHSVDAEYGLLRASPMRGTKAILQRFSQHPLRYASWYLLEKPHLLWGWSIEIGQGDIYIFPTMHSPFQMRPAWIIWLVICRAINTLLMLLALASVYFAWPRRLHITTGNAEADRSALTAVICLLFFVTLVYTALQAEPRYSIPFRSFEILLALTTLWGITSYWRRHTVDPPMPAATSLELHG